MSDQKEPRVTSIGGILYVFNLTQVVETFNEWEADGSEPESFFVTRWNMFADFYLTPM